MEIKNKEKKTRLVEVRITEKQLGYLQQKAALYTKGNLSKWLRAAIMYYKPTKKHLDEMR